MIIFVLMIYITGILIIVLILAFFVLRKKGITSETTSESEETQSMVASDCCGAHEICEFDESIFKEKEIVYFNDEELDELRNVREDQFTGRQIDDLREVLYTLRPDEIGKWLTSIGLRHIHLPAILQQEARQLMAEK